MADLHAERPIAPAGPPLPPGRAVELKGRGTTWIWEAPGPAGAPTLLLLHGWTATAAVNWFPTLPCLSERYHVVAMDVRGHGRGVRARPFSLGACADDAAALCQQLDLPPVIALGYSMGGPIAQLLWRRHPERVGAMVLCATSTHFSRVFPLDPRFELAFELAGRGLALGLALLPVSAQREVSRRALRSRLAETPLEAWAEQERQPNDLAAMVSAGMELRSYDARRWIGRVDKPTAVVATMRDELVSPRRQLAMADAISDATVFPVAGDHGACVSVPRLFLPALLAAICDVVSRQAAGESKQGA